MVGLGYCPQNHSSSRSWFVRVVDNCILVSLPLRIKKDFFIVLNCKKPYFHEIAKFIATAILISCPTFKCPTCKHIFIGCQCFYFFICENLVRRISRNCIGRSNRLIAKELNGILNLLPLCKQNDIGLYGKILKVSLICVRITRSVRGGIPTRELPAFNSKLIGEQCVLSIIYADIIFH